MTPTDQAPATTPVYYDDDFPVTLTIDGRGVRFRIARLDINDYTRFNTGFQRCGVIMRRTEARIERDRKTVTYTAGQLIPNPRRGAKDQPPMIPAPTDGVRPETDDEVLIRVELESTPEAITARLEQDAADETFSRTFVIDAITRFVSIDPGQLTRRAKPGDGPTVVRRDEAGVDVVDLRTGEDLLRSFGARQEILQLVLAQIYLENYLSEAQKKRLRAPRDSDSSSNGSTPTAAGDRPAATAAPASPSTSAAPDAATAPTPAATTSSGPTT